MNDKSFSKFHFQIKTKRDSIELQVNLCELGKISEIMSSWRYFCQVIFMVKFGDTLTGRKLTFGDIWRQN